MSGAHLLHVCFNFCYIFTLKATVEGHVITVTFSCTLTCNNATLQVELFCCTYAPFRQNKLAQKRFCCKERQHVSKRTRQFYFLQLSQLGTKKNLLRKFISRRWSEIREINELNLKSNIVTRQIARKCGSSYLAFKGHCHGDFAVFRLG